ncbi:MAG: hypothetical protein AAFY16_04555, partial [Cyanobacteria bacterium J06642_3]
IKLDAYKIFSSKLFKLRKDLSVSAAIASHTQFDFQKILDINRLKVPNQRKNLYRLQLQMHSELQAWCIPHLLPQPNL